MSDGGSIFLIISDGESFTQKSVSKNYIKTLYRNKTQIQRENYHAKKSECWKSDG